MNHGTGLRRRFGHGAIRAALTVAMIAGASTLVVGTAEAGPYRANCSAYAHSTSPFTGGFTAICYGGPTSVQYRVVGLCKNRFTYSGRFVYGPWMNDGASFAPCSRTEVPVPNGYYQTR